MALAQETRPTTQHPLRSYEMETPDLTDNQRYALVAEQIERDYNRMFFSGQLVLTSEHEGIDYELQANLSPFRIHLAHLMSQTKQKTSMPGELESELNDLKEAASHSINGVITTNFDGFIETLFPDFDVYRGQDDLIVTRATGYAEIYKIHGDFREPENMVFTRKDYDSFEQRKAYLVSKLLSIFVENPLIIIGYSLSDDNIRGVLESIAGCLSKERLAELGERIIFVEYDEDQSEPEVSRWSPLVKYKDFFISTIKTSSFSQIFSRIKRLRRRYPLHLLRRIRQDVYHTVVSNEPTDAIQVLSDRVVLGGDSHAARTIVGFTREGGGEHVALSTEDVYLHFLFHNRSIKYVSFVKDWLPKKIDGTNYPVFFYVRRYLELMGGRADLPINVWSYLKKKSCIDDFLNVTLSKDRKPNRPFSSIEKLLDVWDTEKDKFNKLALMDETELGCGRLFDVLKRILHENPDMLTDGSSAGKSTLRRLIRICDFVENARAVLLAEDGPEASLREAMSPTETARPKDQSNLSQAPSSDSLSHQN